MEVLSNMKLLSCKVHIEKLCQQTELPKLST